MIVNRLITFECIFAFCGEVCRCDLFIIISYFYICVDVKVDADDFTGE